MMKQNFKILLITFSVLFFLQQAIVFPAPAENVELLSSEKYFDKVDSLINKSSKSIFVIMYSFQHYAKYPSSPSNVLLQGLINAAKRGVDVKVLLDISDSEEERIKENQETGKILSRNGIKVYYDTLKTRTHAKTIVIDSRYSVVGSNNWTYSGLSQNNEISVFIDSAELAKETEKYIMGLINIKN